ncbi:hypothetical protein AcW1_000207 [Taiwanofungus camphoratus]|nr:hypothetical protein AcW1_000207 [Antrodia cinnamomea]
MGRPRTQKEQGSFQKEKMMNPEQAGVVLRRGCFGGGDRNMHTTGVRPAGFASHTRAVLPSTPVTRPTRQS